MTDIRTPGVNVLTDEFGELPGDGGAPYVHTGAERHRVWTPHLIARMSAYLRQRGSTPPVLVICTREVNNFALLPLPRRSLVHAS